MSRRVRKMPGFASVAASATAVVDLPTIGTYHKLVLAYAKAGTPANIAAVTADIPEIRVNVNGVTQRRISGAQLAALNAYRDRTFVDGQLEIYLSEPWRRSIGGEDVLAWGMRDVDTFQVEVDLAASAGASPSLRGHFVWEAAERPMGQIIKWRKQTVPVSATGLVSVTNLADPGEVISACHFFSTSFNSLRLIKDDVEEVNVDDLTVLIGQARDHGFIRQSTMYHLDFGATRRVSDFLSIVNPLTGQRTRDLRLEFNMTEATSFLMLVESQGLRS